MMIRFWLALRGGLALGVLTLMVACGGGQGGAPHTLGGLKAAPAIAPYVPQPQTGWWWDPAQGGSGYAIELRGDQIFMAAFMYEANGAATWYVSLLTRQADNSFTGTMTRYQGGQSLLGAYQAATGTPVAQATLAFPTAIAGTLTIVPTSGAASRVVNLQRFAISTPTAFAPSTQPYTNGWWWNSAQGGRGYFIEVQGTKAFVGSFMYSSNGQPTWYVGYADVTIAGALSVPLQQYSGGQSMTGAYRAPVQSSSSPGTLAFNLTSVNTGTMTLPNGSTVALTPYAFSPRGTFTPTGGFNSYRDQAGMTVMADGRVLVSGGLTSSVDTTPKASAEIYDPSSGLWSYTGSLNAARRGHSSTVLANGKVLVAGGMYFSGPNTITGLTSAELYDPSTGRWTLTGSMHAPRYWHSAILLRNGQVLVMGGSDEHAQNMASMELYDPATGQWSALGNAQSPPWSGPVVLSDGRLLFAGGQVVSGIANRYVDTSLIFDPIKGSWTSTGPLPMAGPGVGGTLLTDGRVLRLGVYNAAGIGTDEVDIFDPVLNTWQGMKPTPAQKTPAAVAALPSGKVLVAGGFDNGLFLSKAYLYDPVADIWRLTGGLSAPRIGTSHVILPGGRVLVCGGYVADVQYPSDCEIYD